MIDRLNQFVVHCDKDDFDIYIGRPSRWSNPFSHLDYSIAKYKVATREEAIEKYEEWLLAQPELIAAVKKELRGKVLGCYCYPKARCHGEILAKIANE